MTSRSKKERNELNINNKENTSMSEFNKKMGVLNNINDQIKKISEKIKLNNIKNLNLSTINSFYINLNEKEEEKKISKMIEQRKHLNSIYDKDKRIINHSYQLPSNKLSSKIISQKTMNAFCRNNKKIFSKFQKISRINLYDPLTKNLRYKHYTENESIDSTRKSFNLAPFHGDENYIILNDYNNKYMDSNCFQSIKEYKNRAFCNQYNGVMNKENTPITNILIEQHQKLNQSLDICNRKLETNKKKKETIFKQIYGYGYNKNKGNIKKEQGENKYLINLNNKQLIIDIVNNENTESSITENFKFERKYMKLV